MDRQEMIAELCIRPEGVYISGKVPTRFVTVGGPAEKYDDAEIALLVDFTQGRQAAYHARCGNSKLDWFDNFICFDKEDGGDRVRWGRKRYSWREGRMHSASLPEAIANFWGDRHRDEMIGDVCLLATGDIVEVLGRVPYVDGGSMSEFTCRRLTDGAEVIHNQHKIAGVAAHARGLEALGDQMRMAMAHRIANQPGATSAETLAARQAITMSNDAGMLTRMWANRVPDWFEREEAARAAPKEMVDAYT